MEDKEILKRCHEGECICDDSWKDVPRFPHYDKWVKWQTTPDFNRAVYDITKLPVEEAKEEVEGLTKYFRSMISGKSTKR